MALGIFSALMRPPEEKKKKPQSIGLLNPQAVGSKEGAGLGDIGGTQIGQAFANLGNKVAESTKKEAPKIAKPLAAPIVTKQKIQDLDSKVSNINSLIDGADDLTEEDKAEIRAALSAKQQELKIKKGNEGKQDIQSGKQFLSPQQRSALMGDVKDLSGEKKTIKETIAQSPFGGALENIQTGFEQGAGQAFKEGAGLLSTPKAIGNFLQKNPQIGNAIRTVNPALGIAGHLMNATGGNEVLDRIGQAGYQAAEQFQTQGERGERQQFNPNAAAVGQFAGAAAPYLAAEVLTGGAASGALAKPLIQRGLSNIANPVVKRILGNSIAAAGENVVGEALVNPGRQLQETGDFSGKQFAQDLGVAAAAGGLFGGAIEGVERGLQANKIAQRAGRQFPNVAATLPTEAPSKLTPEDIKRNTYAQSNQRLQEVTQSQKEITQQIKAAEASGDYQSAGQLKQQAKALKSETKALKQTINNLEVEGALMVPPTRNQVPEALIPAQDPNIKSTADEIERILGTTNNLENVPATPRSQPRIQSGTTPTAPLADTTTPLLERSLTPELGSPKPQKQAKLSTQVQQSDLPTGLKAEELASSQSSPQLLNQSLPNKPQQTTGLNEGVSRTGQALPRQAADTPAKQFQNQPQQTPLSNTQLKDTNLKENVPDLTQIGKAGVQPAGQIKAAQKELKEIEAKITQQYVAFTRQAKASPPDPALTRRKAELEKQLGIRKDFWERTQKEVKSAVSMPETRHRQLVEQALREGKNVPPEVLKDYPDLQPNPTSKQSSTVQAPRNQAELEQVYKDTFKLDEPKAKAAAVVTDRIFDTIARRKGITKEAAYSEVGFKKSKAEELQGKAKVKYQIIGELGAKFQKEKIDNLKIAKKLEKDGQSASEIRLATGWEKGKDKKWRLELDPGQSSTNFEKLLEGKESRLEEVLNFPELYKAYPEAKNVKVRRLSSDASNEGAFSPLENAIEIREDVLDKKELSRSVLHHELQHWIQFKEGFGKGGNLQSLDNPTFIKVRNKQLSSFDDLSYQKQNELGNLGKFESPLAYSKDDTFPKQYRYESLVGEVEARNVQSRLNLSPEARNKTLLAFTEDIHPVDQILFTDGKIKQLKFQSEKGAMETLESGKKVIHALTDPNVSTPLHEVAHVYEEVLTKGERNTILEWAGSKEWDTNASEKFARGFERYLAEGKAPIPALKEIFEDFKDWLVDIYKGITGSDIDLKLNKQMRKIYDDMIAADPKLAKELGTKVLNEEQGLAGVRRTLGDYKPKDFQEAARNPSKLKTLSEGYADRIPKNSERIISEASQVKKQLNDVEASLKDNKSQLARIMKNAGVDEIKVNIDGKEYTVKRPTKANDTVVFNSQGREAREELIRKMQQEGKISFDADKGINLAIQTQSQGTSKALKYGPKNVQEAAIEHIKFLREASVLGEKEAFLKEKIMKDIVPNLEDGGLDHVWRNNEGDTSFAVKRNPSKMQFKDEIAEGKFKAEEARLMTSPENVKIKKGEYGSAGVSEAQAMGINRRTKAGKAEYEEFKGKVQRDLEAKIALEDGIETPKQAGAVLSKETDELKKNFAISPLAGVALKGLLNPDLIMAGIAAKGGFSRFLPKIADIEFKNGKVKLKGQVNDKTLALQQIGEALDLAVGSATNIETKLKRSTNTKVKEFLADYEKLRGQEVIAQDLMKVRFKDDDFKAIQKAFKDYGSLSEIQKALDTGVKIEGLEDPDMQRIVRALASTRSKRVNLIKSLLKDESLSGADKQNLELFSRLEEGANKGTFSEILRKAGSLAMAKALYNRITSIPAILTDPILKGALAGFSPSQIVSGIKDVVTHRNSPLFKAFQAGKAGTYINDASGISALADKLNTFAFTTELANDAVLFQAARKFNDDWFKKTGQKLDILYGFDGVSDASHQFSMSWNKVSNELLGVGVGGLEKFALQGDQGVKSFIALMSEPLRYSNLVIRNWESILTSKSPKQALAAAAPLMAFTAYGALIGGDKFMEGNPVLGHIYNYVKNKLEPEDRDKLEETLDTYSLAGLLNVNLGEKIQSIPSKRRSGTNIAEAIIQGFKEGEWATGFTGESVVSTITKAEKALGMLKADNPEGWFELAKALPYLSGPAGTFETILKNSGISPNTTKSVWVKENGQLKEEIKPSQWLDLMGETTSSKNIKKAAELRTEAVEQGLKNLQITKIGKGERARYQAVGEADRFNKLVKVLADKKYNEFSPQTEEQIKQDLLKTIASKQKSQADKQAKFAPKNTVAYTKTLTKDQIKARLNTLKGPQREQFIKNIQQAQREASGRGKAKYKGLLLAVNSQS